MTTEKAPGIRVKKLSGSVTMTGDLRATVVFLVPKAYAAGFADRLAKWLDGLEEEEPYREEENEEGTA